ncbi:salicylate hydroxylase-like protein [Myriangium duriaei CBS 260.36]|uniref:Salicylate hydroxylase-like protein n=1 Tax=Myriangium duriaei CBS 260.36 TaxID=1168546 RepID=A0A9P4J354_9PEZI|nr:salicylate hydroxylase-like protein [Myriangium duriaei CBS 260.36]
MAHKKCLDVLVIGAGLAGLAAAISCANSGHHVIVVESARELAEVGAGLQLTPNGTRILADWGIGTSELRAARPTRLSVFRYNGVKLATEEDFDKNIIKKYGAPFLDAHRVDLQKAMVRKARELGVTICTGHEMTSIEQLPMSRVCVTTKQPAVDQQKTFEADLVVGADGLWSRAREHLIADRGMDEKNTPKPLPTGDLAYRIVLQADTIKDEKLRQLVTKPECNFWIGPGAHAVAYSLRDGTEMNIVLLVPDRMEAGVRREAGNVEEMRKLFDGWDPILTRFLDCVTKVDKWKLMHLSPLDNWTNKDKNVILIGDSCHPMLPYLAQGANSSIEDGCVLGSLLANVNENFPVSHALDKFVELRKSRGEAIARETFHQRQAFHMPDGPDQEARDRLFAKCLEDGVTGKFPSRWTCPEVQPWIYGYNATKTVAEALTSQSC